MLPTNGFDLINTNREEDKYKEMHDAPNHVRILNCPINQYGNITAFPKWYAKIYRYNIKEHQIRDSTINWTRRYLQWSWMKFLTPLAADENSINVGENPI